MPSRSPVAKGMNVANVRPRRLNIPKTLPPSRKYTTLTLML